MSTLQKNILEQKNNQITKKTLWLFIMFFYFSYFPFSQDQLYPYCLVRSFWCVYFLQFVSYLVPSPKALTSLLACLQQQPSLFYENSLYIPANQFLALDILYPKQQIQQNTLLICHDIHQNYFLEKLLSSDYLAKFLCFHLKSFSIYDLYMLKSTLAPYKTYSQTEQQ